MATKSESSEGQQIDRVESQSAELDGHLRPTMKLSLVELNLMCLLSLNECTILDRDPYEYLTDCHFIFGP